MAKPKKGKDGKYHKQAYIGVRPDGTRIYKRFSDVSWHNLMLQIAQYKSDYESGKLQEEEEQAKHPVLTLADAMENYIETCRTLHQQNPEEYSVATIAGYASVSKSIRKSEAFAQIINEPVAKLTVGELQAALNAASLPGKDGKRPPCSSSTRHRQALEAFLPHLSPTPLPAHKCKYRARVARR